MKKPILLCLILMLVSACSGAGEGDPAETVEEYLQAKVDGDTEALGTLLCSEMEANLERESRTFESVSDVEIIDMVCERFGESDTVSCDGKIVALYGAEQTEFPLSSYRAVQEDGEWKWCGEAPTP